MTIDETSTTLQAISSKKSACRQKGAESYKSMSKDDPPGAKLYSRAFGERIRALREARGYTIDQQSAVLGIKYHRLQKYEIGEREPPLWLLARMADHWNVPIDFLVRGNENENRKLKISRLNA